MTEYPDWVEIFEDTDCAGCSVTIPCSDPDGMFKPGKAFFCSEQCADVILGSQVVPCPVCKADVGALCSTDPRDPGDNDPAASHAGRFTEYASWARRHLDGDVAPRRIKEVAEDALSPVHAPTEEIRLEVIGALRDAIKIASPAALAELSAELRAWIALD